MRYIILILTTIFVIGCESESINVSKRKVTTVKQRSADEVFEYEILPPVGSGTIVEKGNTADLLKDIPYLLISKIIPSEAIVNEILASGLSDAGMSGGAKWEPYVLAPGEFPILVKLLNNQNKSLEYVAPPEWVNSYDDWHVWIMYVRYEVPWKEHKRLNDNYLAIEKRMKEALGAGEVDKANKIHLEAVDAGNELSEYVMKHTKRK